MPPSTIKSDPVMCLASSEARKATAAATSCGSVNPQGNLGGEFRCNLVGGYAAPLRELLHRAIEQRGADHSRMDGVAAHVELLLGAMLCYRKGQLAYRRLARAIGGGVRCRQPVGHRGDVDDRAAMGPPHRSEGRPAAQEYTLDVHGEDAPPI